MISEAIDNRREISPHQAIWDEVPRKFLLEASESSSLDGLCAREMLNGTFELISGENIFEIHGKNLTGFSGERIFVTQIKAIARNMITSIFQSEK